MAEEQKIEKQSQETQPVEKKDESAEGVDKKDELTQHHRVVLNNKIDIHTDNPLSDFDHAYADAFAASVKGKGGMDHIAFVVKDRYPVRNSVFYPYYNLQLAGLIDLKEWGRVEWLSDGTERYVVVYKKPQANPIIQKHKPRFDPLTEEQIRQNIITPIALCLRDISDRGIFHGNIRPDNIFFDHGSGNQAILGDCLSSLSGSIQPVLFETIERGMTDPKARGIGLFQDDIYSLGVTVAILARGENPFVGMSDKEIIQQKIVKGSFAMVTEGVRFTSTMSEFLRAALYDDGKQRWTVEQLVAWCEGTRLSARQKSYTKRAARAIEFNGKKYFHVRLLAYDLRNNLSEAVRLIENGSITNWLERSLKDKESSDALSEAISRASIGGKGGGNYASRLVTYVSMALDPTAPIRYNGLSVLPNGIVGSMIDSILTGKDIKTHIDLIKNRYAWTWLGFKENMANDTLDLLRIFDSCSKIVGRGGINNGVERCLYELSPDVPCLSPHFENKYVHSCEDMVEVIDGLVINMDSSSALIDRHIASFLSCRDTKDQTGFLGLLEGSDRIRRSLAMITMFQNLQVRYYKKPLIGLSRWLVTDCETVLERYNNADLANGIREKIQKTAEKGDLTKLLSLVDNPQVVNRDKLEFEKARQECLILKGEHQNITKRLDGDDGRGASLGRELAAVVSGVLAGIFVAALLLINVTGKGGG